MLLSAPTGEVDLVEKDAFLLSGDRDGEYYGIAAFGRAMEPAGDIDDDGIGDLLVVVPNHRDYVGGVGITSGDVLGLTVASPSDMIAFLDGEVDDSVYGGYAGFSNSYDIGFVSALDHNGDGFQDIWVGAPDLGRGYLLDGPVRGVLDLGDSDLLVEDGAAHAIGDLTGGPARRGEAVGGTSRNKRFNDIFRGVDP